MSYAQDYFVLRKLWLQMYEKIVYLSLANILNESVTNIMNMPHDKNLVEIGLDSIAFIQLIVLLEQELDIEIADSDLLLQNFETLEQLLTTIGRYTNKENVIKKALICDCDNVLWSGIAGEENIDITEQVLSFQSKLIELVSNGVLLCLCSKNTEDNIRQAFLHPKMLLSLDHVVLMHANMKSKTENIIALAEELKLLVDSFVFVDDSDYEIGLVRATLPSVKTIKVDYSDLSFVNRVENQFILYSSSADRTQQYREQKAREKEWLRGMSVEEYNSSLETKFIIRNATLNDAERISELSLRTNRFNLSGRRYTKEAIIELIQHTDFSLHVMHICDKYGDMGIVGVAVVNNHTSTIESFFVSCRILGREFEKTLINHIKNAHAKKLFGIYKETVNNAWLKDFYYDNEIIPVIQ